MSKKKKMLWLVVVGTIVITLFVELLAAVTYVLVYLKGIAEYARVRPGKLYAKQENAEMQEVSEDCFEEWSLGQKGWWRILSSFLFIKIFIKKNLKSILQL